MNYGLYLSAAGGLSSMHRQDVYANNLANINTVGYKPDIAITRDRMPARLDHPMMPSDPQFLLEKLGGGLELEPTRVNLAQGALNMTDNPLDTAIRGEGFFAVEGGYLTRDGRWNIDNSGNLVMTATGKPLLDVNNQRIQLDANADVQINSHGEILQNGRAVAQLQFVEPSDASHLQKVGQSLMRLDPQAGAALTPARGIVVQGHLEASSVDPIMTMNAMIGASKAVSSNATMMQYHDHIMDQAINTFGRVA